MYDDENNPTNPDEEEVNDVPEEDGTEGQESSEEQSQQTESSQKKESKSKNISVDKLKHAEKIMTKLKSTKLMSFLAKFILPILPYIILIVVIIIIVIGLLMFLLTMPGMVIQKLQELADGFLAFLSNMWYGKETTMTSDESIISVADYLENMGYDLKAYGFVTDEVDNPVSSDFKGEVENAYIDANGIGRTKDGITNIKSDVLKTYLISDNYVYCVRNFNKNVQTAFSSFENFFGGLFKDPIYWGSGLISIYEEQGQGFLFWKKDKIGIAGDSYEDHFLDGESIKVDPEAKTLTISKSTGFLGLGKTKNFVYNLEGWTGRYGIPLEFLLSVHFTSMSPDLALDLATAFDTNVVILLHETDTTIESAYKSNDGAMLTYEQLDSIAGWSVGNKDTAKIFKETGISSPEDCENLSKEGVEKSCSALALEGNLTSACAACERFVEGIKEDLDDVHADITTYVPYISKVTDHWFRDVYFVARLETEIITNDEDYESETGERWTEYETKTITNEDGEEEVVYQLYKLNDDGSLGEKYDGTSEDAKEEGIRVAKKTLGKTIGDIAAEGNIQPGGWFSDDYWAAYEYKETEGSWEKYEGAEGEDAIDLNNPGQIYYRETIKSNITQTQDGQRGPTNEKIKQIFSTNKYYVYDGTPERANLIEEDKAKTDRKKDNEPNDERNSDLISNFSVTRDSLTAFNMLENMNTLDSDAIYRDFKELIVELDYFDKEDLTNIPTEVFEWPIPECGSAGWPIRRFEKVEDVFGTLINSKVDLENLKESTKAQMDLKGSGQSNSENGVSSSPEDTDTNNNNSNNNTDSTEQVGVLDSSQEENTIFGLSIEEFSKQANAEVRASMGASGSGSGSGSSEFNKGNLIDTATACWQYIVDSGRYTYAGASIPPTGGSTIDCSSYVSWVLYEYGYEEFGGGQHCTEQFYNTNWNDAFGWEEIAVGPGEDCSSQIQPGDLFVRDDGGNNGHIQFILSIEPDGTILTYDCGAEGHWVTEYRDGYPSNFTKGDSKNRPGKIIRIEDPNDSGKEFEGYEGYQDVVSPISGEIIEAGTTTINNIETGVEEDVGFIKIRALSEEDVEAYFNSEDETLEGYKYYLEEYERSGVCDYILYIEGFDLRIVNENLQLTNDPAIIDESTAEVKNSYTESTFEDVLSPDVRETLEEKEEKRVEAKSVVQADGKIFVKEGTVLGKTYTDGADAETNTEGEEGTEAEPLPDDAKERPGISKIPEDKKTILNQDGEEVDMPNGNYIRLILRTDELGGEQGQDKDSIVENVEDYLEIDDGKNDNLELDWEFFYWVPYESGPVGEEGAVNNPPIGSGQCAIASWNSSEAAAGIAQWTCLSDGGANNIPEVCKKLIELDSAFCGSLSAFTEWDAATVVSNFSQVQAAWYEVYSQDPDKFLDLQMQVCYEGDFKPLVESMGMEWILQRPMVVQGTLFSCMNYCPYPEAIGHTAWSSLINDSMDDSAIIDAVLNQAGNIGSTAGSLASRFHEAQPKIAHDILDGTFTDVEGWVRTGQPAEYST